MTNGDSMCLSRVQNTIDLVSVAAKYHLECHRGFFLTSPKQESTCTRGRPEDEYKRKASQELCKYLDTNDECQYSISELLNYMDRFLDGKEGYTPKHLKTKLLNHFKDNITITSLSGKESVVSFRDVSHKILQDKWYNEKSKDKIQEKKRIVEMAASIIRDDIRMTVYECDNYPTIS